MSAFPLRPYQQEIKNAVYTAFKNHKKVLLQLPTGAGKTICFCSVIEDCVKNDKRVMVLVHRKELISQAGSKLFKMGITYGVIMAGHDPFYSRKVQLASIQTLIKRTMPKGIDVIIIDEAHHATANSYREILSNYPDAFVMGVTATPCRASGEGFNDIFDHLVVGKTVKDLMAMGFLVKPRLFASPLRMDLSKIKKTAGDYNEKALAEALDKGALIGSLVESWRTKAFGKKTVVFAINVQHSKHIVETYNAEGIPAVHIDGTTPAEERDRALRQFAEGKYMILSNVGIVTEGFDVPAIECVQLARPTKSLSLYLQMVGRGLRPAEGKGHAIVLDHADCVFEHGFPEQDREWTLAGVKKKPIQEKIFCKDKATGVVYEPQDLPPTVNDIELVEMEFSDIRMMELHSWIRKANQKQFKVGWAWFRFIEKVKKPTVYEIQSFAKIGKYKKGWVDFQYKQFGYSNQ